MLLNRKTGNASPSFRLLSLVFVVAMGTVAATLPASAQTDPTASEPQAESAESSSPAGGTPEPAPALEPAPPSSSPSTTVPAGGPPDYSSSPTGRAPGEPPTLMSPLPPPPGQDRVPTYPDLRSSLPPADREVVSERTRDAKRFANPDGTYLAVFGHGLHYESAPGRWEDVELDFRPSGADQITDRNEVVARVHGGGISLTERRSGKGIQWRTPTRPEASGRLARVSDQGLELQYEMTVSGAKMTAAVTAPRGARRYEFAYELMGDNPENLEVNDRGDLVGDGFVVPRATVVGAQGQVGSPGPWQLLAGPRVAFEFDDSAFGSDAYPYVIDPTTTFGSSAADGWGAIGFSTTYPPRSGYATEHPFQVGNDYVPAGTGNGRVSCASACYATTTGLQRWNTSSLPDNAVPLNALVEGNIGAVDKADNNQELMYSWSPWYPAGVEDLVADPGASGVSAPFRLSGLTPNAYN